MESEEDMGADGVPMVRLGDVALYKSNFVFAENVGQLGSGSLAQGRVDIAYDHFAAFGQKSAGKLLTQASSRPCDHAELSSKFPALHSCCSVAGQQNTN